jgi:nitrogen regulatory protein PII
MSHDETGLGLYLNVSIVRAGWGSKVLAIARSQGVPGGTVLLGQGTAGNPLLQFLELAQSHKEIVLQASGCEKSRLLLRALHKTLRFDKPNRGICFSLRIDQLFGLPSSLGTVPANCVPEEKEKPMHQLIVTIVDKGKGEQVVEASQDSGAKGATIVNARGSGIHETSRLFAMEIEPEKELVMILAPAGDAPQICDAIRKKLHIDEPGMGILYVQPVTEVFGLIG